MDFNYTIIRSAKRKTIALQIKNNAVTVRAPTYTSLEYIQSLVKAKTPWIIQKLAAQGQKVPPTQPTYLPNSEILLYGKSKKLTIHYNQQQQTQLTEHELQLCLPKHIENKSTDLIYLNKQIKKYLAIWLKDQAESYLQYRLKELTTQLQLTPSLYKVKRYKARWGSCNNKHELSFNYLLIMAPSWVFDYVIVHELCHIKYLNHSSHFWALVHKHMPNYQQANQWLKQNQSKMHW